MILTTEHKAKMAAGRARELAARRDAQVEDWRRFLHWLREDARLTANLEDAEAAGDIGRAEQLRAERGELAVPRLPIGKCPEGLR